MAFSTGSGLSPHPWGGFSSPLKTSPLCCQPEGFFSGFPGFPKINLASTALSSYPSLCANLLFAPQCIFNLLSEFPDVLFSESFTASPPCHQNRHHLLTLPGPLVFAKTQCPDPEKLASTRAEFSATKKAGIIHFLMSHWSTPFHMVCKKEGSWRPCGDYRRLNKVTIPDRCPLPNMANFMSRIFCSTDFSKLDLQKGSF